MGEIMDQVMDWLYGVVIAFFNALFTEMNGMGTELFRLPWTKAVVLFFSKLGWALYIVGIVVAVFETALEYQGGSYHCQTYKVRYHIRMYKQQTSA